jgi:3-phenylpropionate/cinnamic acid dioxygenase small subunit
MPRFVSSAAISPSVRAAVEDLLCEFAARVDDGRADSVHELFVESGRIATPRFVLANREQVREHFAARAKDRSRRTRHYWSNARFSGNEGEIGIVTNVMTFATAEGDGTVITVGTSTDVVVPHEGGWAFQSRHLDIMFEGALVPRGTNP